MKTRYDVRGRRRGFSLIEVVLGLVVLIVGAGGFLASIVGGMQVSDVSRETALAQHSARSALEGILLTDFRDVFTTYNTTGEDDPGGLDTAVGANFAVPGLAVQIGDPDGMAGRIIFPAGDGDAPDVLRESTLDPTFSMPRDLSGDGLLDKNDHSDDYTLLPVRVAVEWRSGDGIDRVIEFETFITSR